ncbi:RING finger protein, partial [Hominenteromicrobium sp.]
APYHRGCYKEKGACIFTDLHESGKTWAPPHFILLSGGYAGD